MKHAAGLLLVLAGFVGPVNAGQLTTTFAGGNGQSGNMFDIVVKSNSLTITGFDLNISGTNPTQIAVYFRTGTWVGNDTSSTGWTLADTVGVTGAGNNLASHIDVNPFTVAAGGVTGLYITTNTITTLLNYTDGSTGSLGTVYATNADLDILVGVGKSYPFGNTFTPRIWNGTIDYTVVTATAVPEPATIISAGFAGLVGLVHAVHRRKAKVVA